MKPAIAAFLALLALTATSARAAPATQPATQPGIKHRFLAADESRKQPLYVDEVNPANEWAIPVAARDMQLIGSDTTGVLGPLPRASGGR